jgi:DNA-binding MarR family transcriptional regulator
VVARRPDPVDQLAGEVRASVTRLSRRLRAERGATDVSLVQLSVLSTLHRRGAMGAGDLAAEERTQAQSLTRPLAELDGRGLITRTPDPHDRRRVIVAITAAGFGVLRTDAAQRRAWLAKAIEGQLSATERELLHLATQLLDRLADTGGGPD